MILRRLNNLRELAAFAPRLGQLHDNLDGKWEPDATREEFLESLLEHFSDGAYYFGELNEVGEIVYFAALVGQGKGKALFWLFYMNKDFRDLTKSVLDQLKIFMQGQGYTTVYSQSTRLASSYERWIKKFGAQKLAIIYKFNI